MAGLSKEERAAIAEEMGHYEHPRAATIEALKIVQKARGWVPDDAITAIAEQLGSSASEVEGVATFYSQIFREPVGRHVIRLCDSMVCFVLGHETVLEQLERLLGIRPGQTTADGRFTLLPACCLGHCDKGPAFMIDDDLYGAETPLSTALERYA